MSFDDLTSTIPPEKIEYPYTDRSNNYTAQVKVLSLTSLLHNINQR